MKTIRTVSILTAMILAIFSFTHPCNGQGCHGGSGNHNTNMSSANNNYKPEKKNDQFALHGGKVEKVGKYYVEMTYQNSPSDVLLNFYLMNKKGKAVSNQQISGKVELTFSDQSSAAISLEPNAENAFIGQVQRKSGDFICFMTLKINDENYTARFDGNANENGNGTALIKNEVDETNIIQDTVYYTCPMHPEVKSTTPGNCPKCGMELVKTTASSEQHEHKMGMKCPMHVMGDMNKSEEKKKIPMMAIGMGILMAVMMAGMIVYVF